MHFRKRTVSHGPAAAVLFTLASILLVTFLTNDARAQGTSLQDRYRMLQTKKQGSTPTPSTNATANDPYSNYRSQVPSTSEWNQSRSSDYETDPGGYQPPPNNFQPTRNTYQPVPSTRTPDFGEITNTRSSFATGYPASDPRLSSPNQPRESTMPSGPIGGWGPSSRSTGLPVGYETATGTVPPNAATIYQPADNPDQFVSQPPLTRPGEVPNANQQNTVANQMLLPQQADPYEGMSRWQRLKMRLAAGRPMTVQNTFSTATWLFSGANDVGMFDFYTQATFLIPSAPGFSFTPSFQVYFLDGPTQTDLPARLYSVRWEFRQQYPLHERLAMDLSISPGLYSDFEQGGSDIVRVLGRALFAYLWSEHSQILFGFLYLDRDDVNVLPAGGWIYTPTDDVRMELVFPRPKFAYRTSNTTEFSRWIYLAGEFGGDAWAVERTTGTTDNLAYRDLRLIFGFEQKYANGRSLLLEAGYVFSRQVEFTSNVGDFDPGSTGMLRAGLLY